MTNFQYKTRRWPQTRGVICGGEEGGTGSLNQDRFNETSMGIDWDQCPTLDPPDSG